MKKLSGFVITAIITMLLLTSSVFAYTYVPQPQDIQDLWHMRYYYWDINDSALRGQTITDAQLTITNIYNATYDPANVLFLNLLDNYQPTSTGVLIGTKTVGGLTQTVTGYNDPSDAVVVNEFDGMGPSIGSWSDSSFGGPGQNVTFTFSPELLATLSSYAADGKFGIGIDPDCLYRNDKFTLTINTVPEPSSLLLLGSGLVGLGFYARRRKTS